MVVVGAEALQLAVALAVDHPPAGADDHEAAVLEHAVGPELDLRHLSRAQPLDRRREQPADPHRSGEAYAAR